MTLVFRGKRIRVRWGSRQTPSGQRSVALAISSLLAPCALLAFTLMCWSVAAELRWTASFFVVHGFFSHWQSWLVASIILLAAARLLAQSADESGQKY